jgi:hypothetical protein
MAFAFNPITGKLDLVGSGGGASFDQSLNTSDSPRFPSINVQDAYFLRNAFNKVQLYQIDNDTIIFEADSAGATFSGNVTAPNLVTLTGVETLTNKSIGASQINSGTLADARLSSNVSLDNVNNSFTAGQSINAAANTSALTATYSVTGSNTTPLLDLSGTWNTTGIARGLKLNITDTASAATSLLADFQVGGSSVFSVDKIGILKCRLIQGNQTTISIQSTGGAAFTGGYNQTAQIFSEALYLGVSSDIRLFKDAANTLALRNGGTAASPVPQTFRLYNWQVDSSNYERGFMRWNSNTLEIGTEAGGTGTARDLSIKNAQGTLTLSSSASSLSFLGNSPRMGVSVFGESFARCVLALDGSNNAQLAMGQGTSTRDIFLMRNASTAFEINNGTFGTYRDIRVRNTIQASGVTTTVTPANNGDLVIEQTSNTSITFKMKGTDGVVRSSMLALV